MEKQIVEFNIQDIWPIALVFIIAGLGIAYGLQAMGEAKSDMTTNSMEYNATGQAISGISKFPEKFGTIATIVIAAIIIMILVRYLGASAN
jgi:hypothetical protein